MDRSTYWVLDRAAQELRSPRRQPTKKEPCTLAEHSRLCTQATMRRGMSLARRERIRANSGPCLSSASSSAAISKNSRSEALAMHVYKTHESGTLFRCSHGGCDRLGLGHRRNC